MGSNVISLRTGGLAILPVAGQAEIVGGLATDMVVAEMQVEGVGVVEGGGAVEP